MLTWFQRDPNVSHPTSQETSHPWENCSLAFLSIMPSISGISSGYYRVKSLRIHPRFLDQIIFHFHSLSCVASPAKLSASPPMHSVLHLLLLFHVSGWRTGAGGNFGLSYHKYEVPLPLCVPRLFTCYSVITIFKPNYRNCKRIYFRYILTFTTAKCKMSVIGNIEHGRLSSVAFLLPLMW